MAEKKGLIHHPAPARPTPLYQRIEKLETLFADLVKKLPKFISAGALKVGEKMYAELAEEHGRVFEVQEQSFSAILELFDHRLRLIEEPLGIAPWTVHRVRDVLDAISSYHADVAEKGLPPWDELSAYEQWAEINNRVRQALEEAQKNETAESDVLPMKQD